MTHPLLRTLLRTPVSIEIGGRQPRTIPTKDLPHQVVFLGGWCANCRNPRKRQNTHHPQFCTRDVDRRFCGGGAWISQSDETLTRHLLWEVLNGVGVDGVGGIFPFFSFFFRFPSLFRFFFRFSSLFFAFLRFSSFFFAFLRFSSFFSYSFGTRANDCNLLGKWGISLRPRLHRPRSELPDFYEPF